MNSELFPQVMGTDTKMETLVEAKLLSEVIKKVDSVAIYKVKVIIDEAKCVSKMLMKNWRFKRCSNVIFGVKEQGMLILDQLSI